MRDPVTRVANKAGTTDRSGLRGARKPLLCLVLAAATFAAFRPVLDNGFINYDDDAYVTSNPRVLDGLSADGIRWAWTTGHAGNWHPVTWMSHQLDVTLFGLSPRGHHRTSLLFHAVNAILIFLLFERMTGRTARSFFLAALFALHPLHVESVAWIAERKDVLSTFLWLVTTIAYVRWTEAPSFGRYGAVAAFLAIGLAAKPMLVTLPATLLLLDRWPLGRARVPSSGADVGATWGRLALEKAPLFVLVAISSVVTFLVQQAGGAVRPVSAVPFDQRLGNAALACVAYLAKTVWPSGLAVFYPHPGAALPWGSALAAVVGLVVVTAAAVAWRRERPWFLVGWLWYLGTLVPVIGLVQVGEQAMADRYSYVPLIGIFVILAWGAPELWSYFIRKVGGRVRDEGRRFPWVGVALAATSLAVLASLTSAQSQRWRDSETLFRHALAVTENNHTAHIHLASAMAERGRLDEAVRHLEEAVRIAPRDVVARNNLGAALFALGRLDEAGEQFRLASEIDPSDALARANLGAVARRRGDAAIAEARFLEALALDPECMLARSERGLLLAAEGRTDEAIREFREAVRIRPNDPEARYNLGTALAGAGRHAEATACFSEAVRIRPDHARAYYNLAVARHALGDDAGAWEAVGLARRYGLEPNRSFLETLSRGKAPPR